MYGLPSIIIRTYIILSLNFKSWWNILMGIYSNNTHKFILKLQMSLSTSVPCPIQYCALYRDLTSYGALNIFRIRLHIWLLYTVNDRYTLRTRHVLYCSRVYTVLHLRLDFIGTRNLWIRKMISKIYLDVFDQQSKFTGFPKRQQIGFIWSK